MSNGFCHETRYHSSISSTAPGRMEVRTVVARRGGAGKGGFIVPGAPVEGTSNRKVNKGPVVTGLLGCGVTKNVVVLT